MRDLTKFSSRLKTAGTNDTTTNTRASQELKIGLNNKTFLDSKFTRLIEAPTLYGDYYQKDKNSSSYTERLRVLGDPNKSQFFNKIERFVSYNLSPSEEIDKKDDEERANVINLSDKTVVIPAGGIRPLEGDCYVLYSHQNIKKPFQVVKVIEKLLIDREVYEVIFKESQVYSYEELEERVSNNFIYLESNVGSGNKTIIEKSTVKQIEKLRKRLSELNNEYIECFYDETYDLLRVVNPKCTNTYITIRSLSKFQINNEVLKYGFDKGTLIVNNDYQYEYDDINYNKSIYKEVEKHKKHKTLNNKEHIICRDKSLEHLLDELQQISKINNISQRDIESTINPSIKEWKNEYKFYYRSIKNHIILTNLYNSGITLYELLEINPNLYDFNNTNVEEDAYVFTFTNPLYIDTLNMYYSSNKFENRADVQKFFDFINIGGYNENLEDYFILSYDIEDYIMFPILLYIIEKAIECITKDEMFTSY